MLRVMVYLQMRAYVENLSSTYEYFGQKIFSITSKV